VKVCLILAKIIHILRFVTAG